MRILEVCQDFPNKFYPYSGIFVKQAVDAIFKKGIEIEVVSPKAYVIPMKGFPFHEFSKLPKKEFKEYRIHYPRYIYPVPKRIIYSIAGSSYSFFVSRYIKKEITKPDLIHAHYPYPDGFGMMKMAKYWGVPLIIHVRGTVVRRIIAWKGPRPKIIEAMTFADKILCTSQELKLRCVNLGIERYKIGVVPNGVDANKFRPMDKNKIRKRLNLPLDKRIILFVGYLWPIKGLNYLIDAIPGIVKKRPNSLFLFIGQGHLKNKMIKKCRRYDVEKNVRFLGGKEHDEIPIWLNASDMLILPSLSEGRPNVVLEAMACGIPVIATRVGGTPELVENGFNGVLVEPKDSGGIKNGILTLLADECLRERMGRNGREKILRDRLTWEKYAEKTIEVYGRVLKKG